MIYVDIYIGRTAAELDWKHVNQERTNKIFDGFMRKQKQSVGSPHLRNLPLSGSISVAGEGNSNDHQ